MITHSVGDFVEPEDRLIEVYGDHSDTVEAKQALNGLVALGTERTIEQDPGFAIRVMVDVANKALSAAERPRSTLPRMLEFITRPIRSVLGVTEHDVADSVDEVHDIEANMPDAVRAIKDATASIEHQVEVIDTLATSIDPLRASVDRLTDTMQELVAMLAPIGAAEHEAHRIGRFFGRHPHEDQPGQEGEPTS